MEAVALLLGLLVVGWWIADSLCPLPTRLTTRWLRQVARALGRLVGSGPMRQ